MVLEIIYALVYQGPDVAEVSHRCYFSAMALDVDDVLHLIFGRSLFLNAMTVIILVVALGEFNHPTKETVDAAVSPIGGFGVLGAVAALIQIAGDARHDKKERIE